MNEISVSMKSRFNTVRPSCENRHCAKNQNFIVTNKMRANEFPSEIVNVYVRLVKRCRLCGTETTPVH